MHRLRSFGLIDYRKVSRKNCLYSLRSVTQVKLIPELKKCAFDKDEIKEIFEKIPLDVLEKRMKKVSIIIDGFFEFLQSKGVYIDLGWLWKSRFPT